MYSCIISNSHQNVPMTRHPKLLNPHHAIITGLFYFLGSPLCAIASVQSPLHLSTESIALLDGNSSVHLFDDEFHDEASLDQWQSLYQIENWQHNPLIEYAINELDELIMRPTSSTWWEDYIGPYRYKTIIGDFVVTTSVRIAGLESVAPQSPYSLAGLMIRHPQPVMYNAQTEFFSGQQDYYSILLGITSPGRGPRVLVNHTTSSESSIRSTPVNQYQGQLRLARLGNRIFSLYRVGHDQWVLNRSVDASEFPQELQVGLVASTDYYEASAIDPFTSNNSTIISSPDLVAAFDFVRFRASPRPENADTDSLSLQQIETILGFETHEGPEQADTDEYEVPSDQTWDWSEGLHTVGDRRYRIRHPASWDGVSSVRVLFAFHSCGNQGAENPQYDSYHLSQNGGFLIVMPEAANGVCWRTNPDDVDMPFVAALIEQAESWSFIDASERYVTGWSGGSFMSQAVACHLGVSKLVASSGGLRYIGAGNNLTDLPDACNPTGDMFIHHGAADTTVPITFGEEARDSWLEFNSCHTPVYDSGVIDWCSRVPGSCQCTAYTCSAGTLTWCQDGAGHQQSIHGSPLRDVGEILFNE